MSDQNQIAVQSAPALLAVAGLTGLDKTYLIDTIKRQCFKGAADDAQVDAFISIACEMKVNPLLPGMLYAYPISGGGIVPIMGPNGIYKKLMEHPEVDSWETEVFPSDVSLPPTHATTKIFRKGREKPLQYTALLTEWKVGTNPNWNSRPRHMLGLRALKHCASQIIHGIPYDEDDRAIMGLTNVTGTVDATSAAESIPEIKRSDPKARALRGVAAAKEVVIEAEKPAAPESKIVEAAPVEDIQQAMKIREAKSVKEEQKQVVRAFLKDGERLNATIKLETVVPVFMTVEGVRKPCFKGTASGEFQGDYYSDIGTTQLSEKTLLVNKPFAVGGVVPVVLFGKKSTAPAGHPNHGKILVWIESVQSNSATQESE